MRLLSLAVLAGCGHIGFDPSHDAASDTAIDAGIPGLVAWFPLEDSTGTTFGDVIGGSLGTCSAPNCPTPTPGHHGQGYLFDGNDDCISIPDTGGKFSLPLITIAIWARGDQSTAGSHTSKRLDGGGGTANSWQLEVLPDDREEFTTAHPTERGLAALTPTSLGAWHHLAATWDGSTKRLYIDGTNVAMEAIATGLAYDANPVKIGCDDNGGINEPFFGALDEFQVYDRALSDAEIATLAAL